MYRAPPLSWTPTRFRHSKSNGNWRAVRLDSRNEQRGGEQPTEKTFPSVLSFHLIFFSYLVLRAPLDLCPPKPVRKGSYASLSNPTNRGIPKPTTLVNEYNRRNQRILAIIFFFSSAAEKKDEKLLRNALEFCRFSGQ